MLHVRADVAGEPDVGGDQKSDDQENAGRDRLERVRVGLEHVRQACALVHGRDQKRHKQPRPEAEGDPIVAGKSREFTYTADWLNFDRTVTGLPGVEVLLRLDEESYIPVRDIPFYKDMKPMGADHPICWRRTLGKGRYLFTGLGHDVRSIDTEFGRPHLLAGIRWTAGRGAKKPEKKGK